MASCHACVLIVLIAAPFITFADVSWRSVTMKTSNGDVIGKLHSDGVEIYQGIPFAKPPVGKLRFKRPQPAKRWRKPLDATKAPDSCWQAIDTAYDRFPGVEMWNPNTKRSEDCLYLNVWRPAGSGKRGEKPKTIMVWIFGGGFWSGTTTLDIYEATQLALKNDVIVVSIAYRLGPFGFLSLGNHYAPGNAGLFDQRLALQWVSRNAMNLGGSPRDITIFGESAGAASVGFHMISYSSRRLFTRAIMQSSSPNCDWDIQPTRVAIDRAKKLAESVKCPTSSSRKMLDCLEKADPEVLSDNQWNFVDHYFDMTFGPVIDRHFLRKHPEVSMKKGKVKRTDLLVGVNKNEGIYFALYGFMDKLPLKGKGELSDESLLEIIEQVVRGDKRKAKKVIAEYKRLTRSRNVDILDGITGDTLFKCPVVDFANEYTRSGNDVYMYSFEHRVSTNPWPEFLGVPHGYEIELVFGLPFAPGKRYTKDERQLSETMMEMWTNFAKTGNPNKGGGNRPWPKYTSRGREYVILDTKQIRQSTDLRRNECTFWDRIEHNS